AIKAGVDMGLMGDAYIENLKKLVDQSKVSIDDINRAVKKVLEAKYKLGLFADPYRYVDKKQAKKEIRSPEKLDFALEMAHKSVVLLKNDDHLLPLKKEGTIALIGPLAKDQHDMLGAWKGAGDWHKATSIYQGLK